MKPICRYITNIEDYEIVKEIGRGSFSIVYEVNNVKTNQRYAAKVLFSTDSSESKKMINREVKIMIRVSNPTLIRFHFYSPTDFSGNYNVTLFMDLLECGSLSDVLRKVQKNRSLTIYDNTKRQIILVGIAYGMMIIHQNNVIHRDLKPENILVDEDLCPYITDFGLAKFRDLENSYNQSKSCGTLIYMAPEVILGDPYNSKADVYSFAIIMYQILTNQRPYPLLDQRKMTEFTFGTKVAEDNLRPTLNLEIKESLKNLMMQCWDKDPQTRPTFEEIFYKLAYSRELETSDDIFAEDNDQYYLDGVDKYQLFAYIDSITECKQKSSGKEDDLSKSQISNLKQTLSNFENKIKDLKEEIRLLKEKDQLKDQEIEKLKFQIDHLSSEKVQNRNSEFMISDDGQVTIEPYCTFSTSGTNYISQKWYYCKTCNLTEYNGICENCAMHCHKGHDIEFHEDAQKFYCDCPGQCNCKLLPKSDNLKCVSELAKGKIIEQPMYQCKECNIDGDDEYICQNCAVMHHKGHKLIFNGMIKNQTCYHYDE